MALTLMRQLSRNSFVYSIFLIFNILTMPPLSHYFGRDWKYGERDQPEKPKNHWNHSALVYKIAPALFLGNPRNEVPTVQMAPNETLERSLG